MDAPIIHLDFLLQDLWHWLLEIEICHHELQENLLTAADGKLSQENEDLILAGMCLVSSLDLLKTRLQNEIIAAARDFCTDSLNEDLTTEFRGPQVVASDKRVAEFLSRLRILVAEVKQCMNFIRMHEKTAETLRPLESQDTKLEWKDGKWVKTYRGNSVEEKDSSSLNELGKLKQDFDRQIANILVLEKERNYLALQVEKLKLQLKQGVSYRK